jgi:fructose-specific PTS system IIC-like component
MSDIVQVFKDAKKHILAGVSYLIPVVVVGGICCGLGVAFGGTSPWEAPGTIGYFLFLLGKYGLNLMPAVIAAYIAFSIADKAAIAPGLILGQVAQDYGAGFIGGILAGFFVGVMVLILKKVKVPKSLSALWSIIVIPTVVSVIGAFLMEFGVGPVISAFTDWLTAFTEGLGTGSMILLAIVIGFFGSIDLGLFGNKALGAVPLAMLSTIDPATGLPVMIAQKLLLMVCTTCAIPPLVCCVATLLKPKVFTEEEKESGKAAGFLGLFGITEGSIPLALSDKKVYAGCVIGCIVGVVCISLFNVGSIVNWGGLPNLAGNTNIAITLACWAAGIAAGSAFIIVTKKERNDAKDAVEETNAEVKVTENGGEIDLDF